MITNLENRGNRPLIFARESKRSEWIFSGIFDKVGSSEIVNILQKNLL